MSFIDFPSPTPVFPVLPPLAWSLHKKPIMSSRATTGSSGRETQLACAVYPRWAFILTYGGSSCLRDQTQNIEPFLPLAGRTELEQISGLFLSCLGPYGEFYYDDVDDDSRNNQLIGAGDGATAVFPVYYTWGTGPFTPSLTFPVGGLSSIDEVYFDGVLQNPLHYSIDATKTKIVFSPPPPAPVPGLPRIITANFHFYYRCRFLDDNLSFSQWAMNLWDTKEVRFESVKP